MPKCDIAIEFDRPNREYRGGDRVSGTAAIGVYETVRCNGIQLARGWRTHGRGNTNSGEVTKESLSAARLLTPGDTVRLPFSFPALREPATYHGHHLNIDHYVEVTVDVPWALDAKAEEYYVVLPGAPPDDVPIERTAIREPPTAPRGPKGIVGLVLIPVVALILLPFVWMFLPLIALVVIVYLIYHYMIRKRLGEVTLTTPHLVVAPGEAWPLELHFTPPRTVVLDGVRVRLVAQERCVSGSGKNRSTHTHTLYDQTIVIDDTREIAAGDPQDIRTSINLPATSAFSFDASANHLEWHAEVRIALPRYPDWKKKVELRMTPAEFLDKTSPGAVQPVREEGASVAVEPAWEAEPPAATSVLAKPIVARTETVDLRPLTDALDALSEFGYFGSEREAMIAGRSHEVFACSFVVQRAHSTYGDVGDPRLTDGRMIVGTIPDTRHEVQLLTLAGDNERIDALSRGAVWSGMVRIAKWDGLYNRAVLHEA